MPGDLHRAVFSEREFAAFLDHHPQNGEGLAQVSNSAHGQRWVQVEEAKELSLPQATSDALYKRAYGLDVTRATSILLQAKSILDLPKSQVQGILEVGPRTGLLKRILSGYNYQFKTLDIQPAFRPDLMGSVERIPCGDESFDLTCAFEVLQHLPYSRFSQALRELSRVSRRYVLLSLPHHRSSLTLSLRLKLTSHRWSRFSFSFFKRFFWSSKLWPMGPVKKEDQPFVTSWTLGTREHTVERVLLELRAAGLSTVSHFPNPHFPEHYFFICEKG